jgi:hypothetical protein
LFKFTQKVAASYSFKGLDGHAGFLSSKTYQLTPNVWEDGNVTVDVPHAPTAGRAKFIEQQCGSGGRRKSNL